ncbi:DEAD/DEAH box helicase domain protein [Pseudopedobacter saltans DSM 12145]|uniref:DEAD/DEAH box helicase domain protein n=1 Tax=Pseudopedobacter saltans (strain ATCC 51119 / DSM 12145 / JCM 21818 / CCUG 39354 / LMG 10337 / NBRC 100064 / NCIMB 13643) TaxID=762903 RepID=F0SBH6_PSESL|nr:DEAD/DEAH box helicase [Pseudopedobacter saltans]ADY51622.1 DEAD/DEAH box helicase domain protein [Pseudopedobacter saltans DSM 12145]
MANTFRDLGISEQFIQALEENNIIKPTEIQKLAIPYLLKEGKDFIGQAQTGTGKTAAFGLPVLEQIDANSKVIQVLILCPTRELGQQIAKQLFKFTKYSDKKIFTEAVYGGEKIDIQIGRLKRPTHIVVATPGRLIDLLERKAINLDHVKTIILDEADEMLSMGFKKDIDKILEYTNGQRYTWLFSATIPAALDDIIKSYMDEPFKVEIRKEQLVNENIDHKYMVVDLKDKLDLLSRFLKENSKARGIVFCRTKKNAELLSKQLYARNFKVEAIHGDMGQRDREKVMRAFKSERLPILIATDISARGIDVQNLNYVIHYDLPDQMEYYTHRSGRTARGGRKGLSLIFIAPNDIDKVKDLEANLNIKIRNFNS